MSMKIWWLLTCVIIDLHDLGNYFAISLQGESVKSGLRGES
jgi:hypothetical protein